MFSVYSNSTFFSDKAISMVTLFQLQCFRWSKGGGCECYRRLFLVRGGAREAEDRRSSYWGVGGCWLFLGFLFTAELNFFSSLFFSFSLRSYQSSARCLMETDTMNEICNSSHLYFRDVFVIVSNVRYAKYRQRRWHWHTSPQSNVRSRAAVRVVLPGIDLSAPPHITMSNTFPIS